MTPRPTLRGLAFGLLVASLASFGARAATISLVVEDPGALGAGDQAIQNALVGLSHTVTLHDDDGITIAATAGSDAIVISSSVASGAVSAVFRPDPRPVILWESALYPALGMTGAVEDTDFGFALGVAEIDLVATSAPIGDGLTPGLITVTGGLEDLAWGVPGGDGVVLATVPGESTHATIFVYGQGDALADGSTAAGKRIGFFPDNDSAAVFAADGITLFDQVVAWALLPVPVAPFAIRGPYSETLVEGSTASFTVAAGGSPAPTYQWQKDGEDLPGETGDTLSFVTAAGDEGNYTVVLTNSEGSVTSDPVALTFVPAWSFAMVVGNMTLHPSDQRILDKIQALGHSVTLLDDDLPTLADATVGFDSVLISATVTGDTVADTFIADTRPILLWEAAIYGWMGLTGDVHGTDFDAVFDETQVELIDVTTRLGYGFPLGPLNVTENSQRINWGIVGGDVHVVATLVGRPNQANVFSYAPGALLVDGTNAAGLRIALEQTNESAANWTFAGEQLFEQALSALFLGPLAAPTITTQPVGADLVEGDTATFTVVADGDPPPTYQWRLDGTDLAGETGATLTFTAALEDAGDYDVVVTNGLGSVTSDVATLTVAGANVAPTFTSTPVTAATQDVAYTYAVTATDLNAGDTLTISAPTLPAWLTLTDNLDGTADLSGTPTNAEIGMHDVSLQVEDAAGLTELQDFTITVAEAAPGASAPVFTSQPLTAVTEGQAYAYAITAEDADGDAIALTSGTLPAWLTLTDNGDGTGELAGTPEGADVGTHSVELFADDGSGATPATQAFDIVVAATDDGPPVISLNGEARVVIRQGQTFTDPGATASDPEDGDLTSAIEVDGTVNTQTVATYTLTYSVTDSAGNEAQVTRSVVVQRPPDDGGGGAAGLLELLALGLLAAGGIRRRFAAARR